MDPLFGLKGSTPRYAALWDLDPANDRSGSKPRITALQRQ
jgi:hypothetical protein